MNSRKISIIICLALVVAIIGGFVGNRLWKKHQEKLYYNEKRALFEERNEIIQTLLPKEFKDLCGDPPVPGTVDVTVELTKKEVDSWYHYTLTSNYTLYTDRSFDDYSDTKKAEALDEWTSCAKYAYSKFWDKHLTNYGISIWDLFKIYDLPVSFNMDDHYFIETPRHTYERASYVEDYFLLDGHDHFIREPGSKWYPTPTPTPPPASTWKPSHSYYVYNDDDDYYGAADYIDADDFASDWEDSGDFEDYDDAYDYYEEVMGHD